MGDPIDEFTFVPSVEQFETDPDDLVIFLPVGIKGAHAVVKFFQDTLQAYPWPWKQGDWNNLIEAIGDATVGGRRIVVKHRALPNRLARSDLRTYLEVLSGITETDREIVGETRPRLVAVFPEGSRNEIMQLLRPSGR